MKHSKSHERSFSEPIAGDALVCPDCSEQLRSDTLDCPTCSVSAVKRDGVVSFGLAESRTAGRLSKRELEEFARAVSNGSIRDAAEEILDGHDHRTDVLSEMFDVQRDLWQPLVANHVTGRCLDLHAGYGRRSMVLGELADSVVAVDPSLPKLRIAAARDDYVSSSRVVPVHTSADRLPFPNSRFDTIFADLTGSRDLRSTLEALEGPLANDGSLLFLADGWTRNGGLMELLGLDRPGATDYGDLRPATAAGYRSLAQAIGFDEVSVYALFPTASRPLYAFDVDSRGAIPQIFESYANERGRLGTHVKTVINALNDVGILEKCLPSFLVVCSNDTVSPQFEVSDPLVVAGRTRSVVLELGSDGVSDIYKVPNRTAHEPFTDRENQVTYSLSVEDHDIAATVPEGTTIDSRLGPVRNVDPAAGRPLDEETGRDPASFERVLEIGFDWLIDFQRSYGGDPELRSPAEVRADLQFSLLDVDPPTIEHPVQTFDTPVHGDFMSSNVYYEDGEITSVIDWEYGAAAASPIVDAGHLLLNTALWIDGDFSDVVSTVLCDRNEYADRARARIRHYCDAVGLPYRTFEVYLPTAYRHQLAIDWQFDAAGTYTTRSEMHVRRMQTLFQLRNEMKISDE